MMVQQWEVEEDYLLEFKANNNNIKYKIMVTCGDCFHVSILNTLIGYYLFLFSSSVDPEQTNRVVQETQVLCGNLTRKTWQYGGSFLRWFVTQSLTGNFPWEQVDEEDDDDDEEFESEREVEDMEDEEQPDTPVAESPRVYSRDQVQDRPNFRYNFRKRHRVMVED